MSIPALMINAAHASSSELALEFLGAINQGTGLSASVNVSTSSLSTPTASSFALIVAAGAENGMYENLTDADGNSYTRHLGIEADEYATIHGMNAEVTSMPSTLNFSAGGNRLAFGVYALSGASSLTPAATDTVGPNDSQPYNVSMSTQVGDVCVVVMGNLDDTTGDITHDSSSIEDWDLAPGGACQGRGGSTTATGTTTSITVTHGTSGQGAVVAAAWR